MNELTMGQRIAARRKLLNLSQEALAEQLDISRQAISKWESDTAIPEIDKLIALSKLYHVNVGWLLGVEAQEIPVPDELSESQLKMVEEIVKRYQPEPTRKRFSLAAAIFILCMSVLTICICLVGSLSQSNSNDYTIQISNLEANYSSIQAQIDQMNSLLSTQNETNKLLRSFVPLCYLSDDAENVDITFYFFPKVYHEDMTAQLNILNPATGFSQMLECRWTGDRYLVHATLPLADHYRYSFLLVSQSGYKEEILDDGCYYSDLLTHSSFYIAKENRKYAQMISGQTIPFDIGETVYYYDVPLYIPRIQEANGFVPFNDVMIKLSKDSEIIWEADYSDAFLALYKQDNIELPLNPDIRVDLPALQAGDRLILELVATTHTGRTMVTILDNLIVSSP